MRLGFFGNAGQAWRGVMRYGGVRLGVAGVARWGRDWRGWVRHGSVRSGRSGGVVIGAVRFGMDRQVGFGSAE
jgi:hypothetical protein